MMMEYRGGPDDRTSCSLTRSSRRSATSCWKSGGWHATPIPAPSSTRRCRRRCSPSIPTARRSSAGATRSRGSIAQDALAYYARFYTPENAILIVAGDIDAERSAPPRRAALWQDPPARRRAGTPPPARAGAGRTPPRRRQRREGRAAELAARLSRAVLSHRRARRIRSARSARASPRRRQDERALSQARARGEARRRRRRLLQGSAFDDDALLPLRHAGARRLAARARRRGRSGRLQRSSQTASTRAHSNAPRRASSPTRFMRRTTRRRWRAGTARR